MFPLWETVWKFFTKLSMELDSNSRELNIYMYTITCTQMFLAALFTIAKKWNNQNVRQWRMDKQVWYIHAMKYLAIKN